ncbi:MAG TPA: hypothetical protein PK926_17480 [Spirochaetota bacterium]|nr:hypothetical protein [Spirochaetota bacterium]HPI91060.1 hypothetical protein [Spirochaetota bacterium]HPR49967.1 hypothetical protein [Spirochaetota bacterium]
MDRIYRFITINICSITAFAATLYFFEIINIMFLLVLLFGKVVSVIVGILLSIMLTFHVILLNSGRQASRKLQLYIMDIHAALALASLASFWVYSHDINLLNIIQVAIRSFILAVEIPLIIFLTDSNIAAGFTAGSPE